MKYNIIVFLLCPLLINGMQLPVVPAANEELIYASVRGDVPRIQQLIAAGANVNASLFTKGSPLGQAAAWGRIAAMQALFEAGANPNIVTHPGNSIPLASVLHSYSNNVINRNIALDAAALLLQHGADQNHFSVQQALKANPIVLDEFLKQAGQRARSIVSKI